MNDVIRCEPETDEDFVGAMTFFQEVKSHVIDMIGYVYTGTCPLCKAWHMCKAPDNRICLAPGCGGLVIMTREVAQ